jgi:hypothetical protein
MSAVGIEHRLDELRAQIATLVAQRQQLRSFGAAGPLLEQNRLQLARCQQDFSHALIERHLPANAA